MLMKKNRRERCLINKTDVNKIIRNMGLRYRKVKHIANTANSISGKILRQQWAIRFIEKYHKDRIYLNCDETWLGMSDFRRMKWQAPGNNNSVPAFQMAPRVSLFTALDSFGNVYISLSQSNSNEQMFFLYI